MTTYVVEHKTTSEDLSLGGTYVRRLNLDVQADTYLDGARALGHDPAGVLYDLCRKPAQRPSAKGETAEAFQKRVIEAISEDPNRFYQRFTVVRLHSEQKEAQFDRWYTAAAIRDARRLKVFPRNSDSCVTWGRECEFLKICSGQAEASDPILYRRIDRAHEELDSGDLELLTQSSLKTYRLCPRKYFYRYEERLRSISEIAMPLRVGRSIHSGLEAWWKTNCDLQAAISALKSEDPFDRARETAMIFGYHVRWEEEHKKIKVISVEKEFRTPLDSPLGGVSRTFVLAGRIDALAEMP